MTLRTNARLAGLAFLFYIAAGILSMMLFGRATSGEGIGAKLANMAQHETQVRVVVLLTILTSLSALVLGVTLYAITREQDPDLAMLGLTCRVVEGVNGATSISRTLGVLSLATATGANASDNATAHALAAFFSGGPGRQRHLLRRRKHALLLAPPARPDDPCSIGLARHRRVGSARRGPSPGALWIHPILQGPRRLAHVAADARVRGVARPSADHQGSRCAGYPASVTQSTLNGFMTRPSLV